MEQKGHWLSLDDAATHLRMGKTALYALARSGQVPARRIGRKWVFEKSLLNAWVRGQQPPETFFLDLDFNIEDNPLLREPQRDGYQEAYKFFRAGRNRAILQIPVGCGKTGLAALLPLGLSEGRVMLVAPNLTIKDGLYDAMDITNRQRCFWRKFGVLSKDQMLAGPLACTLETGNISVAAKSHIVITNIQQLSTNTDKWLMQFPEDFFGMIIIDEAHHSAAASWQKVIDRFPYAKIVFLTATPFRSDQQEIDGELVFRYSFRSATLKGYIKRLKASYVAPSEVTLEFRDGSNRLYSHEEVLKLSKEEWFSKSIALSWLCNKHIVDSSLAKLEELRQSGTHHQLIAVACSINHAREIRALYAERGYRTDVIHSEQQPEVQEAILNELRNGILDCIVQVYKLGEGFDHPKLSVAAIFRPFRTLAPYIQFVGRIMRTIVQNDQMHPDNLGHIVTHLGMNIHERMKEFKLFEKDDQAFWEKVTEGGDPDMGAAVSDGSSRLTANEPARVCDEIVDSLWEEDFVTFEEEHIIEDLRDRLELLGLDPDHVEEMVKKGRGNAMRKSSPTESFPVQPGSQWREARKRLDEQAKRLAKILLNNHALPMTGVELPYKYRSLGISGKNNFVSALMMVNREIDKRLKKKRSQASYEELRKILESLDDILRKLVRQLHVAKSENEQKDT